MKAVFSKRLAIPLLLVVAIGTTVGVKALNTPVPTIKYKAVEHVQTQSSEPVIPPAVTPVTQNETTTPVAAPATTPTASETPAPKTIDELKAEAAQRITDDDNNVQQVECFNEIIQYRYGWNISETEMLHRIDNIEQLYTSFCSGWSVVRNSPLTGPNVPPGFRD